MPKLKKEIREEGNKGISILQESGYLSPCGEVKTHSEQSEHSVLGEGYGRSPHIKISIDRFRGKPGMTLSREEIAQGVDSCETLSVPLRDDKVISHPEDFRLCRVQTLQWIVCTRGSAVARSAPARKVPVGRYSAPVPAISGAGPNNPSEFNSGSINGGRSPHIKSGLIDSGSESGMTLSREEIAQGVDSCETLPVPLRDDMVISHPERSEGSQKHSLSRRERGRGEGAALKNSEADALPNHVKNLLPHSLNPLFPFQKAAFTLAEVLITLAIIGIVAALTIPALVQKYKEMETVTRVKKFYSVFSQAYQMAIIDRGTFDTWGLGDTESTEDDLGNQVLSETTIKNLNKFFDIMQPYIKKSSYIPFTQSNTGTTEGKQNEITKRGFLLPDGTAIVGLYLKTSRCENTYNKCGDFYIATDGGAPRDAKTNKYRTNVFCFYLYKDKIEPVGYGVKDNNSLQLCLSGENTTSCTGWVIQKGNMDYLHCDDLDWNTKTKCD